MTKRIVVLALCVWAGVYAIDVVLDLVFDALNTPQTDYAWFVTVVASAPVVFAIWMIGRWHQLRGLRLVSTTVVASVVAYGAWRLTAWSLEGAKVTMPHQAFLPLVYFVAVAEAVVVAWSVARLSSSPARSTRVD
jgi:hypothetical protein